LDKREEREISIQCRGILSGHYIISLQMDKIRVGLVFGGRSGEHEVSLRSAKSIYEALDKKKYEVELLGVDKLGVWHKFNQEWLPQGTEMKSLPNGERALVVQEEKVDVFFPIIHGTFGEDGCLQGLFELLNAAYVGAGVLGSALGMDKEVQKRLLQQAGIPVARYISLNRSVSPGKWEIPFEFPVFVKPANMGSSVGISKISNHSRSKLENAIKEAFKFDTKVLIEEAVEGRELEISVLGNEEPIASLPGEVIPKGHEFYDYEAKYVDEKGAELQIPVRGLSLRQIKEIKNLAIKTFKALECEGMARVDMFLKPDGDLVINEINTLPGFTNISMYPKMWEASGLGYAGLLDELIRLALERKKKKDKLKRSIDGM
jgi:D-alanine-D-alanine ligase